MLCESYKTVIGCRINGQILNVVASRTCIHHWALNNQKNLSLSAIKDSLTYLHVAEIFSRINISLASKVK